jgi:hypothetical protein
MDALVTLASAMLGRDFWAEARDPDVIQNGGRGDASTSAGALGAKG